MKSPQAIFLSALLAAYLSLPSSADQPGSASASLPGQSSAAPAAIPNASSKKSESANSKMSESANSKKSGSAGKLPAPKPSSAASKKPATTAASKPVSTKTTAKSTATKSRPPLKKVIVKIIKAPATVSADGMPIWLSIDEARLASRATNKLILADFYTEWCHWCKVMDRTTFRDPTVARILAKRWVCARIDAEDGDVGQKLAQRYHVQGFPTVMIFNPDGKALAMVEAYHDAEQFLSFLKKMDPLHRVPAQ